MNFECIETSNKCYVYLGRLDRIYFDNIEDMSKKLNMSEVELVKLILEYNGQITASNWVDSSYFHRVYFLNLNDFNSFLSEMEPYIIMMNLTE